MQSQTGAYSCFIVFESNKFQDTFEKNIFLPPNLWVVSIRILQGVVTMSIGVARQLDVRRVAQWPLPLR